MAWDDKRPYLPADDDGLPTTRNLYDDGSPYPNPTKADINKMYENGWHDVTKYGRTTRFVPFHHVRMKIIPMRPAIGSGYSGGRLICETETGRSFQIFADEFERIMRKIKPTELPIDGFWSAEKKGCLYGIILDKLVRH